MAPKGAKQKERLYPMKKLLCVVMALCLGLLAILQFKAMKNKDA